MTKTRRLAFLLSIYLALAVQVEEVEAIRLTTSSSAMGPFCCIAGSTDITFVNRVQVSNVTAQWVGVEIFIDEGTSTGNCAPIPTRTCPGSFNFFGGPCLILQTGFGASHSTYAHDVWCPISAAARVVAQFGGTGGMPWHLAYSTSYCFDPCILFCGIG